MNTDNLQFFTGFQLSFDLVAPLQKRSDYLTVELFDILPGMIAVNGKTLLIDFVHTPHPSVVYKTADALTFEDIQEVERQLLEAIKNAPGLLTLQIGDEAFWNDPDDGLCSKNVTVVDFLCDDGCRTDPNAVLVVRDEFGCDMEVFLEELS